MLGDASVARSARACGESSQVRCRHMQVQCRPDRRSGADSGSCRAARVCKEQCTRVEGVVPTASLRLAARDARVHRPEWPIPRMTRRGAHFIFTLESVFLMPLSSPCEEWRRSVIHCKDMRMERRRGLAHAYVRMHALPPSARHLHRDDALEHFSEHGVVEGWSDLRRVEGSRGYGGLMRSAWRTRACGAGGSERAPARSRPPRRSSAHSRACVSVGRRRPSNTICAGW